VAPVAVELAVGRHATSKLPGDDLVHIQHLGFRGEALPSIGAVSRLTLTSRVPRSDGAWKITVEGGEKSGPLPAAHPGGTRVEVRDLFYATPARLKFLKQPRTEQGYVTDMVSRRARARPEFGFTVTSQLDDGGIRGLVSLSPELDDSSDARLARIGSVLGRDIGRSFRENALPIDAVREGYRLSGSAGVPTLNRANAQHQYLFVNGRAVRDKLLVGAVRGAYADFLARDRHPMVVLFLEATAEDVDVNVHPAKAEVRFRDAGIVRGLIVGALKQALAAAGHRASTTVAQAALGAFKPGGKGGGAPLGNGFGGGASPFVYRGSTIPSGLAQAGVAYQSPLTVSQAELGMQAAPQARPFDGLAFDGLAEPRSGDQADSPAAAEQSCDSAPLPLGVPRAQVHGTYIVAQTGDGIVIVDQHAAHERIVYERMKTALANGGVARQGLLLPEVVELDEGDATRLLARQQELDDLGLQIEAFGAGAIVVRAVPALLGRVDVPGLIRDLADELAELGEALALKERLEEVCGTLACHGSVRAGRMLNAQEMSALLRQMEETPHSGQCNHGRPTYVELKLHDIERLFGRR